MPAVLRSAQSILPYPHRPLLVTYSSEAENTIRASMNFRDFPIRCEVSAASLNRILDEIRNKILRWSLALEKAGVRGEALSFSTAEQQQAHSVQINVQGDAVIGNIASPSGAANIASGAGALIQPISITGRVRGPS
jgi:AbiTii